MEQLQHNAVLLRRSDRTDVVAEVLNGGSLRLIIGTDNPITGEFKPSGDVVTIDAKRVPYGVYSQFGNNIYFTEVVLRLVVDKVMQQRKNHDYRHAS